MAGEKTSKTETATLEDLEKEVDKMEGEVAEGGRSQSVIGAEDDDVEVRIVPEAGRDDVPPATEGEVSEESGEEGEAPPDENAEDAELASYSNPVRARIKREIRLRKAAEDREEAERTARVQAQTGERQAHLDQAEITLSMLDRELAGAEADLKKAKDGGKVDEDIAATRKMGELQAKKLEVERMRDHLKRVQPAQPNPLVVAWERKNRWFGNPEFAPESEAVKAISVALAKKYPPHTEEHFVEVEKELRRRLPNLAARVRARMGQDAISWGDRARPAGERAAPTRQGGPRLASPSSGFGRAAPGQKRQIELTKSDLESMRKVRLDPNNKQHVLQYAREKKALADQKG